MEWTDIRLTVSKADAEAAEAVATMIAGGGIYIEDSVTDPHRHSAPPTGFFAARATPLAVESQWWNSWMGKLSPARKSILSESALSAA